MYCQPSITNLKQCYDAFILNFVLQHVNIAILYAPLPECILCTSKYTYSV